MAPSVSEEERDRPGKLSELVVTRTAMQEILALA